MLTILCVVLYHAIGHKEPSASFTFTNGLFNMLAAFIMPLFMAVSGYLVVKKASGQWTKRALIRWAIPVLAFLVIYWAWARLFPNLMDLGNLSLWDFAAQEVTLGFSGLVTWYLWALMILYAVTFGIEAFARSYPRLPRLLIVWAAVILLNLMPVDTFGMGQAKWFGLFYFAGYSVKWLGWKWRKGYYALAVLFPLVGWLTGWLYPYEDAQWGCIGYSVLVNGIRSGHAVIVGMTFLMGALGIALIGAVARFLAYVLPKAVDYPARRVTGLFLLHKMFLGLADSLSLSALASIVLSMAVYEGVKRMPALRRIMG